MLNPPTRKSVYPEIPDDATSIVRSLYNIVHKLLLYYFKLHKAAKCGRRAIIVNSVNDTWTRKLRHANTIYDDVTTNALMEHLQLRYGDLHALDVVDLTSKILTYEGETEGIPEYTNMIGNAQKKAQQAQLTIPKSTLVAIGTKSILQAQAFTPDMEEW